MIRIIPTYTLGPCIASRLYPFEVITKLQYLTGIKGEQKVINGFNRRFKFSQEG